ncbi:MAG: PilZ domain-containing protein, partial [Desulfuromonadales bacterium]|nr:PilZ domain-containing protein [Desulfuromonadales bacterium]
MSNDPFERRRSERRYALKFLDYEIIDEEGKILGRGLARTLDISETGLRLETGQFFDPGQRLRITLGLDNDLIQVEGMVA